jgi:predicted secreted protein
MKILIDRQTDSQGNEQWNKTFGGSNNDLASSIQLKGDGGYIIAGWTESFGAGGSDAWLIKTDSQGNMQWNRTFGRSNDDWATSLQATGDGGYIIAGWTESHDENDSNASLINKQVQTAEIPGARLDEGDHDAWLIKTDSQGTEQWNRTFGGSSNDWAYDIQLTNDDCYIISGETMSYGAGGHDVWLIKTAS